MTDRDPDLIPDDVLRELSESPRPYAPDLPAVRRLARRRRATRRVLVAAPAAVLAIGVGTAYLSQSGGSSAEAPPAAPTSPTSPTSPTESTAPEPCFPMPTPTAYVDRPAIEGYGPRAWGVPDIGVVSRAISDSAARHPDADGGLELDVSTLVYTQYVVDGPTSATMREDVLAAFDEVAAGSNLELELAPSGTPFRIAESLLARVAKASRTDPEWPAGLSATGGFRPRYGAFVLDAGERYDDPDVVEYFEREFPCVVALSPDQPAVPQ